MLSVHRRTAPVVRTSLHRRSPRIPGLFGSALGRQGIEGLPAPADAVAVAATAEEFAAATAALLYDTERRRRLGGRALHVFRERLSWDVSTRAAGFGSVIVDAGAPHSEAIR